ncbi:hypothetical protein Cgig2_002629 [Carnegiea gigantea]|uniref:RNase H type-1 domain-containing protein n=1 Tax=Carnegiea gigantea TaxID=171969 RepID=A0A9Q1Q9Z6_9CARY|nr:hypothetical protein Cgig2_002629 [Carnegiea gigantea]
MLRTISSLTTAGRMEVRLGFIYRGGVFINRSRIGSDRRSNHIGLDRIGLSSLKSKCLVLILHSQSPALEPCCSSFSPDTVVRRLLLPFSVVGVRRSLAGDEAVPFSSPSSCLVEPRDRSGVGPVRSGPVRLDSRTVRSSVHGSEFEEGLWQARVSSAIDMIGRAAKVLEEDRLGKFVAVMWECWNSRNRFIFGQKEGKRAGLARRAVQYVHTFRALKEDAGPSGLLKINFDAGKVAGEGRGWSFILRDYLGDIILAGVDQNHGFQGIEIEEALACLFALRTVLAHGTGRLVVEGDAKNLICKL